MIQPCEVAITLNIWDDDQFHSKQSETHPEACATHHTICTLVGEQSTLPSFELSRIDRHWAFGRCLTGKVSCGPAK